jgi:hypothetical protein
LDPTRKEIAWNDDHGGNLDALIHFPCKKDGEYTIIATTYDGKTGKYQLTMSQVIPELLAVKNIGVTTTRGVLSEKNQDAGQRPALVYQVELPKSTTCQIDMTTTTFAALVDLEDAEGIPIAWGEWVDLPRGRVTRVIHNTRDVDGTYYIVVTGTHSKQGAVDLPFDLAVTCRPRTGSP